MSGHAALSNIALLRAKAAKERIKLIVRATSAIKICIVKLQNCSRLLFDTVNQNGNNSLGRFLWSVLHVYQSHLQLFVIYLKRPK